VVCATTLIACAARTEDAVPEVSFATADGATIFADVYGESGRPAVVLAHGAAFDKKSWRPLARYLAAHGQQVLALDFRGYGRSTAGAAGTANAGRFEDVLAAVRYLRRNGASQVAVLGASMGGGAAAEAATRAAPGEIDRLVLLAPAPVSNPGSLKGIRCPTLVIASEHEPALDQIRTQYEQLPEPKRFVVLPGSAHAQHVFDTDQAERLRATITDFLAAN